MAKPSVEQQSEYLRTAALLIGKAPAPMQVPEFKKMAAVVFQALCDLHDELVKDDRPGMKIGHQG